jgi:hypothetical protein
VTLKTTLGPLGVTWGVHGSDFGSRRTRDVVGGARSYENRGGKDEASTFVKLSRDAGDWHLYADAQLRWARFRYDGTVAVARSPGPSSTRSSASAAISGRIPSTPPSG